MRKEGETNSQSELFVTVVVECVLCVCERNIRQQFGQVMLQIQRVWSDCVCVCVCVCDLTVFCADQLFKLQLFTVCVCLFCCSFLSLINGGLRCTAFSSRKRETIKILFGLYEETGRPVQMK